MDEIKSHLKEARDAISKKDFETAVKHSKMVLKKDKSNYMGLVMLGVALQDEQSPLAFKKAIALHPDKVLAWQGLQTYYEKNDSTDHKELIEVYKHLLTLEDDLNKYEKVCDKLKNIASKPQAVIETVNVLFNHYLITTPDKQTACLSALVNLLVEAQLENTEEMYILFQSIVDKCSLTYGDDFLLKYIKLMYSVMGAECMFQRGREIFDRFQSLAVKEFICKSYFEIVLLNDSLNINDSEILPFVQDYISSEVESAVINYMKACLFYKASDYFNAYYLGSNMLANEKNNFLLSILVAKCCIKLRRWMEAESISLKLIKNPDPAICTAAKKILLFTLSSQNDLDKCRSALKLKSALDYNAIGVDEYSALFFAYLNLDDISNATDCLSHLKDTEIFFLLTAFLLIKQNKHKEAFNVLNDNKKSFPLCWLKLGLIFWERKDFENSLTPFLQAAKFEKFNYAVFLHLGEYYRLHNINIEKASKCYLKAFTLNSECAEAGKCLSNTYRYMKDTETNYTFLKSVTKSNFAQGSWAYLALGLHHLSLNEWNEALVNLRTFVRFHPDDAEAWESLANAYYSRGSYSSSLKCYQKAMDLDKSRKYSIVRIGAVQCLLGRFQDALATYTSIDENFLPAIKGMADVLLCIANDQYSQKLYGSSHENAQRAITLITAAMLKGNGGNFFCLWNILSTSIMHIAKLPPKYRWLYVDAKFNNREHVEAKSLLSDAEVFIFGIHCLCKAIGLSSTAYSYLYHNLAILYLDYYKLCGNNNVVLKAYAAIKKCLSIEQNSWPNWNTLGVICMSKGIKKYAVAQHAFIKALELDSTNPIIWSNFGHLYLHCKHTRLSNRAFQKAQQFDPSYLQSWIGQALIAESVGHEDTMDLFRHSTELGFHRESSLGYAEWVCKTSSYSKYKAKTKLEYSIKNMHAIPVACDSMSWLIEYEGEDACSLNIFGLLLEKMGLLNRALIVYEKALKLVSNTYKDIVQLNCGRIMYRLAKYDSAIKMFNSVSKTDLNSACGLGLSLYKTEKYAESLAIYNVALQWLSENDEQKSELLVAMASASYKFQGINDCKTLLFQSVQLSKSPCIPALLAIYSIGVLHSEQALSNLVIEELHKLEEQKIDIVNYIGFFVSYLYIKNNNSDNAIKKLISYIHMYPNNLYLWQRLSDYCLTESNTNTSLASKSAQKIIFLSESKENIIQSYRAASVAEMLMKNWKSSIKFIQMAIHTYPDNAGNWVLLLRIFFLPNTKFTPKPTWIKALIIYIKMHLLPMKSISTWLDSFERNFLQNA